MRRGAGGQGSVLAAAVRWGEDAEAALRQLRRSPQLFALALVVLTLACVTNVTIFLLVNSVLLRRLPVSRPGRLVLLRWRAQPRTSSQIMQLGTAGTVFSWPTFQYLRRHGHLVHPIFGWAEASTTGTPLVVKIRGRAMPATGLAVTGGYFAGLGIQPAVGRLLGPQDQADGTVPAVDISYAFWLRRFGGSPRAVGGTIQIGGAEYTIAGVTPRGFFGTQPGREPDFWEPVAKWPGIQPTMRNMFDNRTRPNVWWLHLLARLAPGSSRAAAQAQLGRLFDRNLTAAGLGSGWRAAPRLYLASGGRGGGLLRRQLARPLLLWLAVAALGMIIACSNVSVLMATWAQTREPSMATRLALGAGRGRVARQLWLEALTLIGAASVVGGVVAFWVAGALERMLPAALAGVGLRIPPPTAAFAVIGLTAAVALAASLACTLAPARLALRADLTSLLKGAPPGMPRAFRRRRRAGSRALIGVQIAVAFLVLAAAGLFAATLANLEHANRGFNPRHLLVFRIDASAYGFSNRAFASFSDRLLRRIEALPGVSAASASTTPLASSVINGEQITVPGRPTLVAPVNGVAPGFFNVIGDHLAAGRDFSRGDLASGRRVAVVNQAFARWLFSGRDPLGARFNIGLPVTPGLAYTIVGVAEDVRYRGPAAPGPDWPFFYVLYSQVPSTLAVSISRCGRRFRPPAWFDLSAPSSPPSRPAWQSRAFRPRPDKSPHRWPSSASLPTWRVTSPLSPCC